MGFKEVFKDVLGGGHGLDVYKIDLPLSGDSAEGLQKLISNGTFRDKQDFVKFLAGAYMKNNLGAAMSGGQAPPESTVMDIITKAGIDRGFSGTDVKKMLVPLLITGFMAIYKFMSQRKAAVKPA